MIQNDRWIAKHANQGMITPFMPALIRKLDNQRLISYGLSSFGYDLRLSSQEFKVFQHIPGTIIDPKSFNPENLRDVDLQEDEKGKFFILPAHSYGLGFSLERLKVPENVTCLFIGKSTYARAGIICNLTPGEAGWTGHLTIEISNSSSADCRIYANEGICQTLFLKGKRCQTSYAGRTGKYMNQPAQVVLAQV